VRRRCTLTICLVLAALAAPGSAYAGGSGLQPGVHLDPGSPASKEYQIPLESARNEASGSGSQAAPLFGAGITPPSGPSSTNTGAGSPATRRRAGGRASDRARPAPSRGRRAHASHPAAGTRALLDAPASGSALGQGPAGSGGWLALIAGGAVVLVLGGGGGLLVRRRIRM